MPKVGEWITGVAIAGFVGLATLFPLVCVCRDRARLGSVPGKPDGALAVSDAKGTTILLYDTVRSGDASGERIVAIDAATGRETGRELRRGYSHRECHPAVPGRLWCDWKGGTPTHWALVDMRTLKRVADVIGAVEAAKLGHIAPRDPELRSDAAFVTLDDGRIARFDAATLAITLVLDIEGDSAGGGPRRGCSTSSSTTVGGVQLNLVGDPRTRVVIGDTSAEQLGPRGADFLKPSFLDLSLRDAAVIVHETSLDPKRSTTQLSRIDLHGQVVWTVPIAGGCESAVLVNDGHADSLVLTTLSTSPRALALDPSNGTIRWKIDR